MVISQLPQVEIPSEQTLNDEDNHIIQAFDIILDGYKRSQNRLHAISKAYIELESIAQSLLKDRILPKEDKRSPKKEETLERQKNAQKESLPLQLQGNDSRDDILTVDLTYDFEELDQSTDSPARTTSPIFGHQRKKIKKNSTSDEADSFEHLIKKNKKTETCLSTKTEPNQEINISLNEATKGNEENRPPINKTNFQNSKSSSIDSSQIFNESRTVAKIGFSKTVYNISPHKTPTGKRSRQATLIFQPPISQTNSSCSKKTIVKSNESPKQSNLFDENYRNTKKSIENNCQEEQESPEIFAEKSVNEKSPIFSSTKLSSSLTETPKFDKILNSGKKIVSEKKDNLIIATPSQIDETARSLFDDEDLEEFDGSKDLLNTCLESPSIVENFVKPDNHNYVKNRGKNVVSVASTSKLQASELTCAMDSIDETFFAPVEIEMTKNKVENCDSKSDCLASNEMKVGIDKNRNLKEKSKNETQIEAAKELGDLEVQDIDWDQDMTTDNWPPTKRSVNDSFDVLPQKKNNSPNFAYKGKVERKHAERAKLPGWDCKDCEKYYATMNLPEEELKKHMNRCSRHRYKYNPRYFTPKNFWNPVFPDATDSSDFSDDEPLEKQKKST